jgi:endoribonuclease Dicer
MSDVVESVMGAIYISDNFKPDGCIMFYDRVIKPFFDKHITLQTLAHHPTKTLFELFQTYGCQRFEMIREQAIIELEAGHPPAPGTICEIIVHEVVLARGEDATSANAAKRTSLLALDALEGDAGFMPRTCDCRAQTLAKRSQKKALEQALLGFGDEETDRLAAAANASEKAGDGEKGKDIDDGDKAANAMPDAASGEDDKMEEAQVKAKLEP